MEGQIPAGRPGIHRLKAGNLAAMWESYRAAGATHLIACGPSGSNEVFHTYVDALPRAISADAVLEPELVGTVRIDTNGHTPDESADMIAAATGWPNSSTL